MLDIQQIDSIAGDVARAYLPAGAFLNASSRPDTGPYGEDGLLVMIVVKDSEFKRITGQHAVDTVHQLQEHLRAQGEDRFAAIEWATDAELAASGGA